MHRNLCLIILSTIILISSPSYGAKLCHQVFKAITLEKASKIGFSQNFIGHEWALKKTQQIVQEFDSWSSKKGNDGRENFIREITQEKPLLAIRDIDGNLRLIDGHHRFFAISKFIRGKDDYKVHIRIVKDYSITNPATGKKWSTSHMMRDLIRRNYVFILGKRKPSYSDLKKLPDFVETIMDLPERSIIGMVFQVFEMPLKGSDFTPMIQFLLSVKLSSLGVNVITEKPYSSKNIERIKNEILASKKIIRYMISRINPHKPSERKDEVLSFLRQYL